MDISDWRSQHSARMPMDRIRGSSELQQQRLPQGMRRMSGEVTLVLVCVIVYL